LIAKCGELAPGEDDGVPELADGDKYEDYPEDDAPEVQTDPQVALNIATEVKQSGAALYKEGKIAGALEKFEKGIRYLDVHPVLPDGTPEALSTAYQALLASLLLNCALCCIKLPSKEYATTGVKYATRALSLKNYQLSPTDKGKALYRRAIGRLALKEEDDAFLDLQEAHAAVPGDKAINDELAKLKAKQGEKKQKEKAAFSKMFK